MTILRQFLFAYLVITEPAHHSRQHPTAEMTVDPHHRCGSDAQPGTTAQSGANVAGEQVADDDAGQQQSGRQAKSRQRRQRTGSTGCNQQYPLTNSGANRILGQHRSLRCAENGTARPIGTATACRRWIHPYLNPFPQYPHNPSRTVRHQPAATFWAARFARNRRNWLMRNWA